MNFDLLFVLMGHILHRNHTFDNAGYEIHCNKLISKVIWSCPVFIGGEANSVTLYSGRNHGHLVGISSIKGSTLTEWGHLFNERFKYAMCNEKPYTSDWKHVTAQRDEPFTIDHPLGEYPVKVDVQIKVIHDSREIIFSGIGTAQRDDDLSIKFAGVVYLYNDLHVRIFLPKKRNGYGTGGVAYTGGKHFDGPFEIFTTTAEIRIRVWKKSDFPPPAYQSLGNYSFTESGNRFIEIEHNMSVVPDMVVVTLETDNGYLSEAQGVIFASSFVQRYTMLSGVVFGYNKNFLRIWAVRNSSLGPGYLVAASDGWGYPEFPGINSAKIHIRAWKINSKNILFKTTLHRKRGISANNVLPLTRSISVNNHIVLVNVEAIGLSNDGFVFNAAGNNMMGGGSHGGILYAYNESAVCIWQPVSVDGYLVYIGGEWGDGTHKQASIETNIDIKVISFEAKYAIEMYRDMYTNEPLISKIVRAMDCNFSTCFSLPVPGDLPSILWVKIKTYLMVERQAKFVLTVTGYNLSCTMGGETVLHVSYPTSTSIERFHGDIKFCKFTKDQNGGPNDVTSCSFQCPCADTEECDEVIIFMGTKKKNLKWHLCEIDAKLLI